MEFGKRDLGLLLSEKIGDADTLRFTKDETAVIDRKGGPVKPRVDPSKKVHIYRPGQVPAFARQAEEERAAEAAAAAAAAAAAIRRARWGTREDAKPAISRRSTRDERDDGVDGEAAIARSRARARARAREIAEAVVLEGSSASDSDASPGPVYGGRDADASDGEAVEGDVAAAAALAPRRGRLAEGGATSDQDEEDNDEAIAARRARIRDRLRARRDDGGAAADDAAAAAAAVAAPAPGLVGRLAKGGAVGEATAAAVGWPSGRTAAATGRARPEEGSHDEGEEEGSSEWETDTDDDSGDGGGDGGPGLLKPVFVPRNRRQTVLEAERLEAAEAARAAAAAKDREARARETRDLVAAEVRREADAAAEHFVEEVGSEAGMPEDDDNAAEEALEYEAWKVRELVRVKRDRDERERLLREKEDTERRRNMTAEQRAIEDKLIGKNRPKEKEKWRYLQKYYHKGAFYMDDETVQKQPEDVRRRDYSAPTLEDKFNKEAMPEVMQVRNFGRSGRTKWKHLAAEDTTDFDAPWAAKSHVAETMAGKLSGTGDIDAAFDRLRKKKQGGQSQGQGQGGGGGHT